MTPTLTRPDTDARFQEIVDELTRRGFLAGGLGAAAVIGLAACGSNDSSASDAVSAKAGTSTSAAAATSPTRIIAGTAWAVNTLMDLGITPVGAFNGAQNVVLPRYRSQMAAAQDISASDGYSDDLEKIAALHPDLIFTFATSPTFAKEKQIAKTIGQDAAHHTWDELCAQVAEAVGKSAALGALRSTFQTRMAALKSQYGTIAAATTWYVVQPGDHANPATLYAPANTEAGVLITQLGGTFGTAEAGTTYGDGNTVGKGISAELLPTLKDGDAIIVWDNGSTPSAAAKTLYAEPLWRSLPAVRKGQVYRSSMPGSYGQALAFVDLLETALKKLQETR